MSQITRTDIINYIESELDDLSDEQYMELYILLEELVSNTEKPLDCGRFSKNRAVNWFGH